MRRQVEIRKNTVSFTPCRSHDETLAQEFQKGEISGIYQNMHMLPLLVEALGEEISERLIEENEEDA